MDPYLEHPEIFPNLHQDFITYLKELLQPNLPAPYYARSARRTWIEVSERYVEPDTNIHAPARYVPGKAEIDTGGGVAVATGPRTKPIVVHVPHDEHREVYAEIYAGRGSDRRLVTTIEVLSPTNKGTSGQGRELYLKKQKEMLESDVHLVEIDLLRGGTHTSAVPLDRLRKQTPMYDYHVCIHRFDQFEDYFVYPFHIQEPLPTIDIPLLPGDGSVPVDLQAVLNRCYDVGPYRREIEYQTAQIVPPLRAELTQWARKHVG
jgi:hypothetical protein